MRYNEIISEDERPLKRYAIPYVGHLVADAIGADEWENLRPGASLPWGKDYMGGSGYILTMKDGNRVFLDATLEKGTIYLSQVSVENRASGLGTLVMEALHKIAEQKGWTITVYKVTNQKFFSKFPWLREKTPGTFISEAQEAPEHIQEALWWVTRYVSGSLNDPDWDWGEQTHLDVNQAMEIVSRYVGNQNSVGKPLYRYLNLSRPQALEIKKTMVLRPHDLGFQSFTEYGELALEIGRDIHPDAVIDTVVRAEIPSSDVMFGMADLKRAMRLPGVGDIYMQLADWHHQGEVIVRVTGPLKLLDVKISKPKY